MKLQRLQHRLKRPNWENENASAYQDLLRETVIPDIEARSIPGLSHVDLMRRELDNEVEFTTVMWFQDLRMEAEI